jgi:ABC-2 type transport system permease protein
MELYLVQHSLKDYLRFMRLAPWLALCVLGAGIAAIWPKVVPQESQVQYYADLSSMLVFHLVPLAAAIMVTAIVGQEVEQKTIVYLLTRPVSRKKLLLSRYIAACLTVSGLGILCALVLSTIFFHNPLKNELLGSDAIAIVLGSFAYGGLFLLISLLVVKSMIPCMLFFVWEVSASAMPGDIYRLSIYSYMQGIAQHPTVGQHNGIALLTGTTSGSTLMPSSSYPVLIFCAVVFTAISLVWFSKFEYVPREDAD